MHPIIITNTINQYFFNIDLVNSLLPHIGKLLFFDTLIFKIEASYFKYENSKFIKLNYGIFKKTLFK